MKGNGTGGREWAAARLAELVASAAVLLTAAGPVSAVSVVLTPAGGGPPVVLTAHAPAKRGGKGKARQGAGERLPPPATAAGVGE
jgi:hypothetical protein